MKDLGERLDQQRLRQPWHPSDQAVPAREQCRQHKLNDIVLPDDDLAEFSENQLPPSCHAISNVRGAR